MAGHAQLKFVKTECSKTQIRLTGPKCRLKRTDEAQVAPRKQLTSMASGRLQFKNNLDFAVQTCFIERIFMFLRKPLKRKLNVRPSYKSLSLVILLITCDFNLKFRIQATVMLFIGDVFKTSTFTTL